MVATTASRWITLKKTHPGAEEELEIKGLSVCRNTSNIGQSTDGAGEQTFMHSAKPQVALKILLLRPTPMKSGFCHGLLLLSL